MSSPDNIVCLYIFSGFHVGAEINLSEGSYTVGTGDACDIILKDSFLSESHARLDVSIDNDGPFLQVVPLNGEVWVNEELVTGEGYFPAAGDLWYLGESCFGWNIPGINWQNKAAQLYEERLTAEKEKQAAMEAELVVDSGDQDGNTAQGNTNTFDEENLSGLFSSSAIANLSRFPVGKIFNVVLLTLLLGAMLFSIGDSEGKEEEYISILAQLLKDNKFTSVSVTKKKQQIILRGFVKNEAQRQLVYSLAQSVHYPVHIDVGVQEDLVNAVKSGFASRGIYVSVSLAPAFGLLDIFGYMEDAFVEEWAISAMKEDVPTPFRLNKHIVYAKEVGKVLQDIFTKKNLSGLKIEYSPGDISISGSFDEEKREKLSGALKEVKEELGVPIVFKIRQIKPSSFADAQQSPVDTQDGDKSNQDLMLGGAFITGVTLNPIPFIILNTGERIFKGGVLPSGYILNEVSLDTLIFYKDSEYVEYPIGGER